MSLVLWCQTERKGTIVQTVSLEELRTRLLELQYNLELNSISIVSSKKAVPWMRITWEWDTVVVNIPGLKGDHRRVLKGFFQMADLCFLIRKETNKMIEAFHKEEKGRPKFHGDSRHPPSVVLFIATNDKEPKEQTELLLVIFVDRFEPERVQ